MKSEDFVVIMKNIMLMWYMTMCMVIAINLGVKYIIAGFIVMTVYVIYQLF